MRVVYRPARTAGAPEHVAPLSMHAVFRGREIYETREGRHALEHGRYLVLNDGQRVSTRVGLDGPVDSLSVLFEPAFAREVLASLATPLDRLLDDPEGRSPAGVVARRRRPPDTRRVARGYRIILEPSGTGRSTGGRCARGSPPVITRRGSWRRSG